MKRALVFVALWLTVVPVTALATPPDHLASRLEVLCSGGDRLAMLVHSVGNAGTYYITDNRWHLVMIDTASHAVEWQDHGAVAVNTVNALEEGDAPEVSYRTGDAAPLGASLQAWGVLSCGTHDASAIWAAEAGRFDVAVSEQGVFLTFAGRRRELEVAGTWDPGELAWDQFPWHQERSVLQSLEPISTLGAEEGISLSRTLQLQTRTVFVVELKSEFGHRDLVLASPRTSADRAMAWLVNARGLDEHRAGRPEVAAGYFGAALDLDPTFDTARYNLACAAARSGAVDAAVRHLSDLPGTAELRAKIAVDADFDGVRGEEPFQVFVATLP